MQFGVIYLKTQDGTQLYVSFSTFIHSCFFVSGRTHAAPDSLTLISQCLLELLSSLFNWLVEGACLPCVAVKTISGEGSLLMWGGSVYCITLGPPVNLWTKGTVGQQFVLLVHCVKSVSVMSSVSLSVSLSL
jgi:hypothetical protein